VRALIVAVLLVVGAALWAWFDMDDGVETWRSLRREAVDAMTRVEQARERNASLRAEIQGLRSDPLQQERAVREELRWSRPGETIVRAPGADASTAPSSALRSFP
jgi:cell division protein FtsB